MPPKRKIPKTVESEEVDKEITSKLLVPKKGGKLIQAPTRTLRPRSQLAHVESAKTEIKVKTKSVKITKNKAEGDPNNKKESLEVRKSGKKRNVEHSDEVLAEKRGKLITKEENDEGINATSIYEFTAKVINGESIPLKKYEGHVCIIVNVASRCGHTASNYKEFVEMYDKYSNDKGLRILAFPCNQFGRQEPGDNEKICEFAKKRGVKFDIFEKIEVNGTNAHPLWKYLTSQKQGPKGRRIDWNFTKFLINKEGQVVERFKPSVKPSALVEELEKLW